MEPTCFKDKKSTAEVSKTVEFLKALSEENRLKILCILREGEQCVCDIWQYLDLPQNLVSHHLKVLKDFGLISSRKEGLKVFYKLNKEATKENLKLLNRYLNRKGG